METRYYISVKPGDRWRRIYPRIGGAYTWQRLMASSGSFSYDQRRRAVAAIRAKYGADTPIHVQAKNENPFRALERTFDLVRTSKEPATPGVHTSTSWHYQYGPWSPSSPRAADYGASVNSHAKLDRVGAFLRDHRFKVYGYSVKECYGPFPYYVKNSYLYSGQFPAHGDHLHVAL